MQRLVVGFCLLGIIVPLIGAAYVPYDCRRSNQKCFSSVTGGICNGADGKCLCNNSDYIGFDCTLRRNQIVTGNCLVPCRGNDTICYTPDGGATHRCYCNEADYGDFCELKRVSVECFPNSMVIRVNPQTSDFRGQIHVLDLATKDFPDCEFEAISPFDTFYRGFAKNLSIVDDPGINQCRSRLSTATIPSNGALAFTYEVMVRYSPDYTTTYDEIHTATCQHDPNGALQGVIVDVDSFLDLTGTEVEDRIRVIKIDVVRRSDQISVITNNMLVRVGDSLFIQVILNGTQTYKSHVVENCAAYNVAPLSTDPNKKEKLLVTNRCPAEKALDAVLGPITKVGNVISIPIGAFRFQRTGELHLYCSVRVCETENDPDCAPSDCTPQWGGVGSGYGRRKRTSGGKEYTAEQKFYISDLTGNRSPLTEAESVRTESCFRSVAFLVVTAVFSALLLLALLVTFLLYRRLSRQSSHRGKADHIG